MRKLLFIASLAAFYFSACSYAQPPLPPTQVTISADNVVNSSFDPVTVRAAYQQKNYNNFKYVPTYHTITQSDMDGTPLVLGQGDYKVNNPILIDEKKAATFIHGVDRMHSRLVPTHPGKPLLILNNAKYVNITNVSLAGFDSNNGVNIQTTGDSNIVLDIIDCFLEKGTLLFDAPGSYRLQGNYFTGQGLLSSQIILNNNFADLFVFGGNMTNAGIRGGKDIQGYFHIWSKAGRLKVFGTSVEQTLGIADFRIDRPAPDSQTHQIINVRSEGENGLTGGNSALVYVPPTKEAVNVDIINSAGSWGLSGPGKSTFIKYNGAGTVQLIGNSSAEGAGQLVARDVDYDYQLVAIANSLASQASLPASSTSKSTLIGNLYSGVRVAGRIVTYPQYKMISAQTTLPALPLSISIPPPLARPKLEGPLPSMLSVKEYGAKGDGTTDDTAAIQKAFNAGRLIYFPNGIYKISKALGFNMDAANSHDTGGFIAGPGSDKVIIRRVNEGPVFQTQGMAYATIQGLTFESKQSNTYTPKNAALSLEWTPGIGHATQANTFYDLAINNADVGIGIGNFSPSQCSENFFDEISIKNTKFAISIGSWNALANFFSNLSIQNADVAIGHGGEISGGSWSVLNGQFMNIGTLLKFSNSSDGIYFFDKINVPQTPLFSMNSTGASFNMFFNNSTLSKTNFQLSSSGGVFFNNSDVNGLSGEAQGSIAENYIINNSKASIKDQLNLKKGSMFFGR